MASVKKGIIAPSGSFPVKVRCYLEKVMICICMAFSIHTSATCPHWSQKPDAARMLGCSPGVCEVSPICKDTQLLPRRMCEWLSLFSRLPPKHASRKREIWHYTVTFWRLVFWRKHQALGCIPQQPHLPLAQASPGDTFFPPSDSFYDLRFKKNKLL